MLSRFLAGQFARPSGAIGRWIVAPWLDRIARGMNRLTLEQLALRPGDHVLEIGFGGGDLIAGILKTEETQAVGVDISEAVVARASHRFAAELSAGRLALHLASAERLPLGAAAVHKAASLNSLYFWPDPAAALAELARVVRPGGTLLLAFEPPEELRKWPGHRHGFRMFAVAEVRALMEAAGFGALREAWGTGRKPDRFCCLSGTRIGANG